MKDNNLRKVFPECVVMQVVCSCRNNVLIVLRLDTLLPILFLGSGITYVFFSSKFREHGFLSTSDFNAWAIALGLMVVSFIYLVLRGLLVSFFERKLRDKAYYYKSLDVLSEVFSTCFQNCVPNSWCFILKRFQIPEEQIFAIWKFALTSRLGRELLSLETRRLAKSYLLNKGLDTCNFNNYTKGMISYAEANNIASNKYSGLFRGKSPASKFLTHYADPEFELDIWERCYQRHKEVGSTTSKAISYVRLLSVRSRQTRTTAEQDIEKIYENLRQRSYRVFVGADNIEHDMTVTPISRTAVRCIYFQNYKCLDDKLDVLRAVPPLV